MACWKQQVLASVVSQWIPKAVNGVFNTEEYKKIKDWRKWINVLLNIVSKGKGTQPPGGSMVKNPPAGDAGDTGLTGLGSTLWEVKMAPTHILRGESHG